MTRTASALTWSPGALGPLLPADYPDLSWQDAAECQYTDPEIYFPEKGGGSKAAKRICRKCEVRAECLEDALANDERFGVRGGLSVSERDRMVKRPADAPGDNDAAAATPVCHAGHLRTPDNLYVDGSCRTCKIDRAREAREAARVARVDSDRRLAA